jgi:pantoate--beta-alanine ligase
MLQLDNVASLRAWRANHDQVAFVPTMGNLHAGHLSLVELAKAQTPQVLVSLFVNPLQFGPNEDFARYPRTLDADLALLRAAGVSAVFTPDVTEIYPVEPTCFIEPSLLADELCGQHRPGHFRGVCTVVMKLFHLAQPTVACFGQKDYQQLTLIRRMSEEFLMPIQILGGETVRAADGLALSSRNQYLSLTERSIAPQLYANLQTIARHLNHGHRDYIELEAAARKALQHTGWQVDYVSIREPDLRLPVQTSQQFVVLAAAKLGNTRLIDNVEAGLR